MVSLVNRLLPNSSLEYITGLEYNASKEATDTFYQGSPQKASDAFFRVSGLFAAKNESVQRITLDEMTPEGNVKAVEQHIPFVRSEKAALYDKALAGIGYVPLSSAEDAAVIKKIVPSVVRISVESEKNEAWYGSGVIVDPIDIIPGYIPMEGEYFVLTNNHVAEGARYLSVKLNNGMEYMGEVVESVYGTKLLDRSMDIALVRIVIPYSLPMAKIGDPKALVAGEAIFTAGHPRALPRVTVTKGIISSPQQETGNISLDILSDAPINPGNSGGPAFTEAGEVIGLNTYTFRNGEDLTFTKPIDEQIEALRTIWLNGVIIRGAVDFKVEDYPLIEREKDGFPSYETGARVAEVKLGSSPYIAGLRTGDIITWMEARSNGAAIDTLDVDIQDGFEAEGVIKRWAAKLKPGTEVALIVWRKENGKYSTHEISITASYFDNSAE